jgi:hypothetical protein
MDSNYYGFQRSGSVNTESLVWAEDPEVLDELSSFVGILPDNYLSVRGSLSTRSPEAAMMCAILEDAVNCFQRQLVSPTRRASRLGQEAEEWFFDDDCRWLFPLYRFATYSDWIQVTSGADSNAGIKVMTKRPP